MNVIDMNLTECVLGMDQHGSHTIPDIVEELGRLGIFPVFTPSYCTDVVSPVDHHVGARLKQKMATYYHAELDKNFVDWCKSLQEGGLHTWERRVLIAKWLAEAWEAIKTDSDFIKAVFVSTGFLLAAYGSDDKLVKIKGIPDYSF